MINRLLHQLATAHDAEPRRPSAGASAHAEANDGFETEMSRQLLGARYAPARDAEGEAVSGEAVDGSIAGAVRRHIGGEAPSAEPRDPSLTGLLLDPPLTSEEVVDAKSFEEERTAPEVPSLRSASMEAPISSGHLPPAATPSTRTPPSPVAPGSVEQSTSGRSTLGRSTSGQSTLGQSSVGRRTAGPSRSLPSPGLPSHLQGTAATDALLRERALARFSGDASSSAKIALERTPEQPLPRARDAARYRAHTIPVQARGAATFIPAREGSGPMVRSGEQPGEPRVERITKPIKPSLLKPAPPGATFDAASVGRSLTATSAGRPVTLSRPEQWATPQIVKTMDDAWRPRVGKEGAAAVEKVSPAPAEPVANGAQTPDAVEPVVDAADATPQTRVSDTLRAYVDGQRGQLASPSEATSSVMQAVVDQVRSLMDGLGLEGKLQLRTDGAEVQVQSDALGTLAARIGVEHGVVDLTLSGQAAASLTAELDALKAMLAEAGLTVGTVKTSSLASSDGQDDRARDQASDEDDAPRSGSTVAEDEDDAGGSSGTRRRAHHGQVNVSA